MLHAAQSEVAAAWTASVWIWHARHVERRNAADSCLLYGTMKVGGTPHPRRVAQISR
jgi:hypothetical protein